MTLLRFAGGAKADLSAFPERARTRAGYDFMIQSGREPADWKPMPVVGPGAAEIIVRYETGAYRVIYVARFEDAIYVLHAFQNKSQKTARVDLMVAAQRYRDIKSALEQD